MIQQYYMGTASHHIVLSITGYDSVSISHTFSNLHMCTRISYLNSSPTPISYRIPRVWNWLDPVFVQVAWRAAIHIPCESESHFLRRWMESEPAKYSNWLCKLFFAEEGGGWGAWSRSGEEEYYSSLIINCWLLIIIHYSLFTMYFNCCIAMLICHYITTLLLSHDHTFYYTI